jgi:transcriptional regulator with XRE-family HTH domain
LGHYTKEIVGLAAEQGDVHSLYILAPCANGQQSDAMTSQWYERPDARQAAARGDYGTVIRLARVAMGLTQRQVGVLAGYSAASISRYETGAIKLTDMATLHQFARVLGVPMGSLGLSGVDSALRPRAPGQTVEQGTGHGPQRREVLALGLGAVSGVLLPVPALGRDDVSSGLDELLFGTPRTDVPVVSNDRLRSMMASAARDFRACRYRELAGRLPEVVRVAEATRDDQPVGSRCAVETVVSDGYALATDVLTKFHEDGAAWATADRAVRAAGAAGDPRALARAQRLAAIVMRRSAHRRQAGAMVVEAARRFASATAFSESGDASFYASMLCTASYTAALADQRSTAYGFLDEARQVLAEHGAGDSGGGGFGTNDVTLYGIGVSRALGDYGSAVDHAGRVRIDLLGSPERRARYWEDVALAWWGRGRRRATFEAMLNAERAAPQEVRYRPWAQHLASRLMTAPGAGHVSGLREFATRAGVV